MKKKFSVLQITANYPPHLGGQANVVRDLAEALSAKEYIVRVLTSDQDSKAGTTKENNVLVTRMRSVKFAHSAITWSLLPRIFKMTGGETVVHLHIGQVYTPEAVWLASKIKRFEYVAHLHIDPVKSGPMGFLLPIYKKFILKNVLRDAKIVIVPTLDYKKIVEKSYGIAPEKVTIIANGTNHKISNIVKTAPSEKKPVKILFVGRLSEQKNIELMLNAIRYYSDKYNNKLSLNIVGNGELRSRLITNINELRIQNLVKIEEPVFGRDLEKKFSEADIFMLTSKYESFGVVLIEAMTKGLPIISVNIPAVRNIIKNKKNGLLCKNDSASLGDAINVLLVDKELYAKVSSANLFSAKSYQWSNIIKGLERLYEN